MMIVDESQRLVALAQRNDVVDLVHGIARIRVAHPLQVAQGATVAVVTAAVRVLDERLACRSQAGSARRLRAACARKPSRMQPGGRPRVVMYITASWTRTTSNVRPRRSVRMSPRTCSHSGLRPSGERQHLLRDVRQRAIEASLQVTRVVAAPGPELEQRPQLAVPGRFGEPHDRGGFLRIVLRRCQEVEPVRELGVEAHRRDVSRFADAGELHGDERIAHLDAGETAKVPIVRPDRANTVFVP